MHGPALAALALVVIAVRLRWLTPAAAALAGAMLLAVVGASGWTHVLVPATFFVTGSLVSRRGERGERVPRSLVQVAANGGAGVLALLVLPSDVAGFAFTGAFAAATADTWSSEIGSRANNPPRLITTGQVVQPGLSGGVTWLGTAAGLGGALLLVAAASLVMSVSTGQFVLLVAAGCAGGLADSISGAVWQARFGAQDPLTWSDDASSGPVVPGFRPFDNDAVNLICTFVGAFLGGAAA